MPDAISTSKHTRVGMRTHVDFIYDPDGDNEEWGSRLAVYPTIYRSIGGWSGVFKVADVECSFVNHDQAFKGLSLEGKTAKIVAGFRDDAGTVSRDEFYGVIERTEQDDETGIFTIGLVDRQQVLLGSYLRHDLLPVGSVTRWPHLDECQITGADAAAILGTADALVGFVAGTGTYYPQTSGYTDNYYRVATCWAAGGTTFVQFAEEVRARAAYAVKRADLTYYGNPADVVGTLLTGTNGPGIAEEALSSGAFGTSAAACAGVTLERTFPGGVIEDQPIGTYLQEICVETNGDFWISEAGTYHYMVYYPPMLPGASLGTYRDAEMLADSFRLTRRLDTLWNAVSYDLSRVTAYRRLPENRRRYGTKDLGSIDFYDQEREQKIQTKWLHTHLGCQVMGQRRLLQTGTVTDEISFSVPLVGCEESVGNIILVTNADVNWSAAKYCQILGLRKDWEMDTIEVEAMNVDALYSSGRRWQYIRTGTTAPEYGTFSATAADCACVF